MSGDYTADQASGVIEACARAAYEASASVEGASGIAVEPWGVLADERRREIRRLVAVALDLLDGVEEATSESADRVVEQFAFLAKRSPTRANLFVSVVAAVRTTIDDEQP